jgi:hypothetical protein
LQENPAEPVKVFGPVRLNTPTTYNNEDNVQVTDEDVIFTADQLTPTVFNVQFPAKNKVPIWVTVPDE